ncbi:GNAT family N-acetyltransferase [Taylorella equigenitalis]|uniref:GNAT family N-acetyltransferase n=1 Tax=Taylorella equigenitalis TaxID=29575 RepID=UPI0003FC64DC|nr:GNAT family N-acetyltransferase [Taylorella equigenitalis]ASY41469.1 GNAT family N-acetyltransferase [Taylorella equigenitalis]
MTIEIQVAQKEHALYADDICHLIYTSAMARGTGIAKRTPEYIIDKIENGKAIIALDGIRLVGFSYIETFSNNRFVTNSGLVVHPEYRNQGVARRIKKRIFELARKLYPQAKIISITTGLAVMKMNTELGFKPVTFSELPADEEFWRGCSGCRNYDILQRNNNKMCLCTGLLFDPMTKPKGVVKSVSTFTRKFVPIAKGILKKDRL